MDQSFCITKIYDAATSESQWDETMDVLAMHTGARAGIAFSTNIHMGGDRHSQKGSQIWRDVPKEQALYVAEEFKHYEREAFERVAQSQRFEVLHDGDEWDLEVLRHRPDMLYYGEHFGFNRRLAARLSDHPSWMEVLTLQFDRAFEIVPMASRHSMAGIVQHVGKVLELNRSFALLEQRHRAVLMALDHVHIGVCIARDDGRIIISNKEADRILDGKDALWLSGEDRLTFPDRQQTLELQRAVELAVSTTLGRESQVESLMHAERASGKRAVLIEVAPISDGLHEIQSSFQGALVYLIDPENPVPIKIDRLALACALSEAEAAVCERVAHGWKNGDIAEDRNVSLDTIKSQIAHVFSKTGVKNRSELIRLILKSSPPVG